MWSGKLSSRFPVLSWLRGGPPVVTEAFVSSVSPVAHSIDLINVAIEGNQRRGTQHFEVLLSLERLLRGWGADHTIKLSRGLREA
jgi:hypothetical protein